MIRHLAIAFGIAIGIGLLAPMVQAQAVTDADRKALIEDTAQNPSAEQLARKARSVARITAMGVPVLDSLPVIASEDQALRRSDTEVAGRALALMIVALKGETGDQALIDDVIAQYRAHDLFTPAEQAFIKDPAPSEDRRVDMSWRYESVAVLLWAVGLIDTLPPPDQIIDAGMLGHVFRDLGREGIAAKARLRPQSEVLDMADLVYRLHWATVNARVSGETVPGGLHPGILFERHYALNWLYGYAGLSWDDMRTDT